MYTQCPDCATAFRVTAQVLKQAAGKVRCGGCGNAFNALAYLSETRPSEPVRDDTEEALPELRPDSPDGSDSESTPRAISAEQSAALLKTLDELAGSDIRLEDTGVEWRLLPDDEDDFFSEGDTPVDAELSADAGASRVDELLEDTPTEVDEFLTETPSDVEAAEVFDDPSSSVDDELRFDDNTGLPENFDFDADTSNESASVTAAAPEPESDDPVPHTETQVDLLFGDPDEWNELLDEVVVEDAGVAAGDAAAAADVAEPILAPAESEHRDAMTGLTFEEELDALPEDDDEDRPLDIDTQFDLQAEALGIDTSGIHDVDDEDTSIDDDLIAAAFDAEKATAPDQTGDSEPVAAETGFADDSTAYADLDDDADTGEEVEVDDVFADVTAIEVVDEASPIPDSTIALEIELARAQEHSDDVLALIEDDLPAGREPEDAADEPDKPVEPVVPPETEEEQTINRMIDQDLLRLAIEDDDGVASTMVLQGKKGAGDKSNDEDQDTSHASDAQGERIGVETIIMEGEFVRTALEQEALMASQGGDEDDSKDEEETGFIAMAKRTFRGELTDDDDSGRKKHYSLVAGIAVLTVLLAGQFVHQSRAALATIPAVNSVLAPVYRAIGAPITPEWDITGWRFEVTRGSTNASGLAAELREDGTGVDIVAEPPAGDADVNIDTLIDVEPVPEVLTIYSRIGNKSDRPLPYPLVSVSLTDRYEEIIGSKVLEPRDYLTGNLDPRRHVAPGNTFDAVIAIESPAADATGFKLNVCYRQASGKLRCAIEDFK